MSRHIHTKIVTWRVKIEVGGYAHPELNYDGYDGRRLSLIGESDLSPLGGRNLRETEIGLHPSRSREAIEINCDGFAQLWPAEAAQSALLGVSIDLPRQLWAELWQRSLNPPPVGWVGFTVAGVDVERIDTEFPTGKRLPILSPYVSLSSK